MTFRWENILFLLATVLILSVNSLKNNANQCWNGPDVWCLNKTMEDFCNFTSKTIGVCGYSSKRCPIETGDQFCQKSSSFNGGITGSNEGIFSFYMLSLYWPPSSCRSAYNPATDFREYFCSPYTNRGQPGSERLVLHGLWPTFWSDGDYQSWPQFCTAQQFDWSECHVDGNLCPWSNSSDSKFSQSDYEYCLAVEGINKCLVDGTTVLQPFADRLKTYAPGYLNAHNLFINHEWTKHGSCSSSTFKNNISTYLDTMLNYVEQVTAPGSLSDKYIQKNLGKQIRFDTLINSFNQTAVVSCNSKCQIDEVSFCIDRDASTGLPSSLIRCPKGSWAANDSCQRSKCDFVSIPPRD